MLPLKKKTSVYPSTALRHFTSYPFDLPLFCDWSVGREHGPHLRVGLLQTERSGDGFPRAGTLHLRAWKRGFSGLRIAEFSRQACPQSCWLGCSRDFPRPGLIWSRVGENIKASDRKRRMREIADSLFPAPSALRICTVPAPGNMRLIRIPHTLSWLLGLLSTREGVEKANH